MVFINHASPAIIWHTGSGFQITNPQSSWIDITGDGNDVKVKTKTTSFEAKALIITY